MSGFLSSMRLWLAAVPGVKSVGKYRLVNLGFFTGGDRSIRGFSGVRPGYYAGTQAGLFVAGFPVRPVAWALGLGDEKVVAASVRDRVDRSQRPLQRSRPVEKAGGRAVSLARPLAPPQGAQLWARDD